MPYTSPAVDPNDPLTRIKTGLRARIGDPNSQLAAGVESPLSTPPAPPAPPGSPQTVATNVPAPTGVVGPQNQPYTGQIPQPSAPAPLSTPQSAKPSAPLGSVPTGPDALTSLVPGAATQQESSPPVSTEPVGQPTTNPNAPTTDQVTALYQQYLGRAPDAAGLQGYLQGGHDLAWIENAIKSSPEAQAYAASHPSGTSTTGAAPTYGGNRTDPNWIASWVKWAATQPGANPSLANDPNYWIGRITQTGGLGPDNTDYWMGLARRPEGAPEGGGGSATTSVAAPVGSSPFTDQIRQMLLARLQADMAPTTGNEAAITQPYAAAQLATQRSTEQERKALAEQAYGTAARGGGAVDQGAITQGIQQSGERNAVGLANIKSQLFSRVIQSKIDDLNAGMSQALASGDAETARNYQWAIAQLQAELTREGYGVTLAGQENQQNTAPFSVVG